MAGLPFVMAQATVDNYAPVLLVYLGGAAILTALMARAVDPEERRAGRPAFRREEYEKAVEIYESPRRVQTPPPLLLGPRGEPGRRRRPIQRPGSHRPGDQA